MRATNKAQLSYLNNSIAKNVTSAINEISRKSEKKKLNAKLKLLVYGQNPRPTPRLLNRYFKRFRYSTVFRMSLGTK